MTIAKRLLSLGLAVLLCVGCSASGKKLDSDVAVLALTFDKVFTYKDGGSALGRKGSRQPGYKPLEKVAIAPSAEALYFATYEKIRALLSDYGYTVIDAREIADKQILDRVGSVQDKRRRFNTPHYVPVPFKGNKYAHSYAHLDKAAESLECMAGALHMAFLQKKIKGSSKVKIGLDLQLQLVDKNAIVHSRLKNHHTFYSDQLVDPKILRGPIKHGWHLITVNETNQGIYDQVVADILTKLDKKLSKRLPKKAPQ